MVIPILYSLSGCDSTQQHDLAIVGVNVLNPASGTIDDDQTVYIDGDSVSAMEPRRRGDRVAARVTIDGTGLIAMPGLWDMHVHMSGSEAEVRHREFPLFVAHGVVYIRDMCGGCDSTTQTAAAAATRVQERRKAVAGEALVGPEIIAAGFRPEPPFGTSYQQWASAEAVGDVKAAGYDFVKVYQPDRETYFRLLRAAADYGIPVAGHVPYEVSVEEAVDSGLAIIEHMTTAVLAACVSDPPSASRRAPRTPRQAAFAQRINLFTSPLTITSECQRHGTILARNRTAIVPTLSTLSPTSAHTRTRDLLTAHAAALKIVDGAGVVVLAGTDYVVRDRQPGESIHQELEMLAAALSPLKALQAATVNAATVSGVARVGSIAKGSPATMILLDANPMVDVRNTRRIVGVIQRGRYYDRAALNRLVETATAGARSR